VFYFTTLFIRKTVISSVFICNLLLSNLRDCLRFYFNYSRQAKNILSLARAIARSNTKNNEGDNDEEGEVEKEEDVVEKEENQAEIIRMCGCWAQFLNEIFGYELRSIFFLIRAVQPVTL